MSGARADNVSAEDSGSSSDMFYLVSDTRERNVHDSINRVFGGTGVGHAIAQIPNGDYLICRKTPGAAEPTIVACIERKTHADFAASLRDGRHENRGKMIDLRARTGCQLFYIVEGPAFRDPKTKIPRARCNFQSIYTACDSLMIRDQIFVCLTKDVIGTASQLLGLVRSFQKHSAVTGGAETVPAETGGIEDSEASSESVPPGAPAETGGTAAPDDARGEPSRLEVPSEAMIALEKSFAEEVAAMWAALTGISIPTALTIAARHTIADFALGTITDETIDELKTPTNRAIARSGKMSLRALRRGRRAEERKILVGINGISSTIADRILDERGGLKGVLNPPGNNALVELAATQVPRGAGTMRLGEARATRILRLLRGDDASANETVTVTG